MAPLRFLLYVVLMVIAMCTAAGVYTTTCDSTYVRTFEEEEIACGVAGDDLRANVTATRIHSPSGRGKYGKQDELRYKLVLTPGRDDFSAGCLKFLNGQCLKHPQFVFADSNSAIYTTPSKLNFVPVKDGEKLTSYRSVASVQAPANFGKITTWHIIWDLPPPPPMKKLGRLPNSVTVERDGTASGTGRSGQRPLKH